MYKKVIAAYLKQEESTITCYYLDFSNITVLSQKFNNSALV